MWGLCWAKSMTKRALFAALEVLLEHGVSALPEPARRGNRKPRAIPHVTRDKSHVNINFHEEFSAPCVNKASADPWLFTAPVITSPALSPCK